MFDVQSKKDVDVLIEAAKWQMYGEEWTVACRSLQDAKLKAIGIGDKIRIDIIQELLRKAGNQEKVPMSY